MIVQFKALICRVEVGRYDSGERLVMLINATTNVVEEMVTISLSKMGITPHKDNILVRDLHGEKLLTEALIRGEVIKPHPVNTFHTGYCEVNEYKLTRKAKRLWK